MPHDHDDTVPLPAEADVRHAIAQLVRQELGADTELSDDAELAEHLDSVQRLTLVVAIEDHFDIAFEPEDDDDVTTLAQAAQVVLRRLAEPEPAGA